MQSAVLNKFIVEVSCGFARTPFRAAVPHYFNNVIATITVWRLASDYEMSYFHPVIPPGANESRRVCVSISVMKGERETICILLSFSTHIPVRNHFAQYNVGIIY